MSGRCDYCKHKYYFLECSKCRNDWYCGYCFPNQNECNKCYNNLKNCWNCKSENLKICSDCNIYKYCIECYPNGRICIYCKKFESICINE